MPPSCTGETLKEGSMNAATRKKCLSDIRLAHQRVDIRRWKEMCKLLQNAFTAPAAYKPVVDQRDAVRTSSHRIAGCGGAALNRRGTSASAAAPVQIGLSARRMFPGLRNTL